MLIKESLVSQGYWLFRWRSYLPLVLFAILLTSMLDSGYLGGSERLQRWWGLFCLAVSLGGLALRAYVVGCTPRGTSGRNTGKQIAKELNTTGAYSLVRHPLYLANFLIWMGVALFVHNWWVAALSVLTFWLYYERIMAAEEDYLRGQFGDAYLEWAEVVPAFLPRLHGWRKPSLRFSFRTVLKKEYSTLLGIALAFLLMDMAENYALGRGVAADPLWLWLAAVSLVLAAVLRLLRKYTSVLHLEGR